MTPTHSRRLIVGKTLNLRVDVSGNLDDPLTSATVTPQSGLVTIGAVDFTTNPITFAITGDAVGIDELHIDYATVSESDCVSVNVIIEEC